MPEPHSIAETDEFAEYIGSITDIHKTKVSQDIYWKNDKGPTQERVKWIKRWTENEQFMCFASAEYFVTRYGWIRDAEERIVHFNFRLAQRIFLAALAECDDQQIAIQLYILKARQVGCSTVVAQFFLHRILFRPNTYAVMASVQAQQSDKLAAMIETTWSRLPFWLVPPKTSIKAKEPRWSNGSLLSVQSGNQEVGIAQGTSPSCIHISEIGDYANPKRVLEEGLFPACHATRSLFMVLEGTGSMATTWQREKWDYYTENLGKGGRFTPFFIPPSCAEDLYPPKDWLRAQPIPEGWSGSEATARMRRRSELFVRSTGYLSDVLGRHWEMGRNFQWYWECLWKEAVASHSERQFLSQYAPTPEDAFQSENDPVFTRETIEVVNTNRNKAYKAYAITGRTILVGGENKPYQPNMEEIDWTEQRVSLQWEASDGNSYEWDLVPLKAFDDTSDQNCFDKLFIFQPPEPHVQYSIGIDTAYGLNTPNEDRASLTVHRFNRGTDADEQVASYTSLKTNAPQMARVAACVAVLFGTDGSMMDDPKFIIEQVRKPGDECQHQLKIMGFTNHHIMHFYDQRGNIDPNKGSKEGWRTTAWSRSILLERFVDAVNTGWLILHDPVVVRQLADFARKYKDRGLSTMEHSEGAHDDNIFSNAMAWTTNHDLENTALRIQNRYAMPKKLEVHEDNWCERLVIME